MAKASLAHVRKLRSAMTDAERHLWRSLKSHQTLGFRFRRQQTPGNYSVDFVCLRARLVVEGDGGQHSDSELDARRDEWLRRQDFTVMRFWNHEVLQETEAVLQKIMDGLADRGYVCEPPPQPSPEKGEGAKSEERGAKP